MRIQRYGWSTKVGFDGFWDLIFFSENPVFEWFKWIYQLFLYDRCMTMDFNLDWLLGVDYTLPSNFVLILGILFIGVFLRYLLLAWGYHELVYKKYGSKMPYRRLHEQIKLPQVKTEIWYSFLGAIIFAFSGTTLLIFWQRDW